MSSDDQRTRIAKLSEEFEAGCRAGRSPSIEKVLADVGEMQRATFLRALLVIEFRLLLESGTQPELTEYFQRFPLNRGIVRSALDSVLRTASADSVDEEESGREKPPGESLLQTPSPQSGPGKPTDSVRVPRLSADSHVTGISRAGSELEIPEIPARSVPVETSETASRFKGEYGRYRVQKILSVGDTFSVLVADDPRLKRRVALRVPHVTGLASEPFLDRFRAESRAAALLHHPGICPVYDIGESDGVPFLAMAFIDGTRLTELLGSAVPELSAREAIQVIRKVALALDEAHRHKIIHRGINPNRIVMDDNGEPVLMGFGTTFEPILESDEEEVNRSVEVDSRLYTIACRSPEQLTGDSDDVTHATDLYSLGVVTYALLTGRLPFDGPVSILHQQIAAGCEEPPSSHCPGLNSELDSICLKLLAVDPDERFESAIELADRLAESLDRMTE